MDRGIAPETGAAAHAQEFVAARKDITPGGCGGDDGQEHETQTSNHHDLPHAARVPRYAHVWCESSRLPMEFYGISMGTCRVGLPAGGAERQRARKPASPFDALGEPEISARP